MMSNSIFMVGDLIKVKSQALKGSQWQLPGSSLTTGVILDMYETDEGISYASIFWNDPGNEFMNENIFWYPVAAITLLI
jgi:hypothetical protein